MKLCLTLAFTTALCCFAQENSTVPAQKEAMKKLEFLVGEWAGPATVNRGPGQSLQITQHETVQVKLDGLALLVEGRGERADGAVAFRALAIISYEPAASQYRIRAYNDGRFLDAELTVRSKGFEWGYTAGPLTVKNVMTVTAAGQWQETTDSTYGQNPASRAVDMMLAKLK